MAKAASKNKNKSKRSGTVKHTKQEQINVPELRISKRNLKILGWVVTGFIVFWLYAYLGYGSPRGMYLDLKPFPGAHAEAVEAGRYKAEQKIGHIQQVLGTFGSAAPVYVSPLQKVDVCEKGRHQNGFAAGAHDNYSYRCNIHAQQYYAYSQSPCEILKLLVQAKIDFGSTEDCTSSVPELKTVDGEGGSYFHPNGPSTEPLIELNDNATFRKNVPVYLDTYGCSAGLNPWAYCTAQNSSVQDVKTAIHNVPITAQTVLTVWYSQLTYYQK